jgi:hypothetical protein
VVSLEFSFIVDEEGRISKESIYPSSHKLAMIRPSKVLKAASRLITSLADVSINSNPEDLAAFCSKTNE